MKNISAKKPFLKMTVCGMSPFMFMPVFLFILLSPMSLYAVPSVTSFTSNPSLACGASGSTIQITTVGMCEAYQAPYYAICFSADTTAGNAGDVWVIGTSCGGGGQIALGATEPATPVDRTKVDTVTIPAGTFNYIILIMSVNNGGGCTNMAQLAFATSCSGGASPTPTGVQNKADSDASTTNAVGLIVFSPTPSVTYSQTVSPTLTRTLSATLSATLTSSYTWTLTQTLTRTVTVTLTQTLTATMTPPIIIALTKTIDKHIYSLGEQVNYCLRYTNNGTTAASFSIWDTIPAVTDFVSCSDSCSQVTYGSYHLVVWNIVNLGVGVTDQVCFVVQVNRLPYIHSNEFFALFDRKKYQEYSLYTDSGKDTSGKQILTQQNP